MGHLAAFAGVVGIPAANILGPLIVWLVKKDQMPLVDEHGKESLNFQISMTIYSLVCIPLVFIVIGIFLLIGLAIFAIIMIIRAALKANSGESWRYPLTIRFIK